MKRVKLKLSGLACEGCVNAVKNALEKAGAKVEKINLEEAEILIENDVEKFVDVIKKAGYDAKV